MYVVDINNSNCRYHKCAIAKPHWQHRIPNGITSLETIYAHTSGCLVCSFYIYDVCVLVVISQTSEPSIY